MPRLARRNFYFPLVGAGKCICFQATLKWWLLWTLIIRFRLRLWNMRRLRMQKLCDRQTDENQCQVGSKWFRFWQILKAFFDRYGEYRVLSWFLLLIFSYRTLALFRASRCWAPPQRFMSMALSMPSYSSHWPSRAWYPGTSFCPSSATCNWRPPMR